MLLRELLNIDSNIEISNITSNSKDCTKDSLFVCVEGINFDGHKYIKEAVRNGASFIVCNKAIDINIPHLVVDDTKQLLKELLIKFYPLNDIKLIGVTGTDGKTTTSLITKHLLEASYKVGYIGTNGIQYLDRNIQINNTTPSIETLFKTIYHMQSLGIEFVVLEVSSHALAQGRVNGLTFANSIFTNISPEHQDYHSTLDEYALTKAELFRNTYELCVVNLDDDYANLFVDNSLCEVISIGIKNKAGITASNIKTKEGYTEFNLHINNHNILIETNLFGTFNVYNILCALTIALYNDIDLSDVVDRLKNIPHIDGRQHFFEHKKRLYVIDFAHTPNAISNLVSNLRTVTSNRIILIIGACGNRDSKKRPIMGQIATSLADHVIFTDEDPKTECGNQIINDLTKSLDKNNYSIIRNRKDAIKFAFDVSNDNDYIVIIGKGNEKFQDYGNIKVVHNDIETCMNI